MRQNSLNLISGTAAGRDATSPACGGGSALDPRDFHGFVTIHDYNPARDDKQFG